MSTRLSCEEVVRCLTELDEGTLSFLEGLRLRLHLLHCAECRELAGEIRITTELIQKFGAVDPADMQALAESSLRTTLARIADFKPVRHPSTHPVPRELEDLLRAGGDVTLEIMAAVHRAFAEGTAPLVAPFLPESALALLPATDTWSWKPRGIARTATLLDLGNNGPRLSLLVAPRGFQTPAHIHGGSEEMLVLDGLLEDGQAAYPTGCWVHFGEGSSHAPIVLNDECWCLIREVGPVRYTGPLGWLWNLLAA